MALISRWITCKQLNNIHLGCEASALWIRTPNENKYLSDPATYYSFLIQNVKPRFTSGSALRGRSGWACPLRGSGERGDRTTAAGSRGPHGCAGATTSRSGEWRRLAMRMGLTAAALRARVWRNRLPRRRRRARGRSRLYGNRNLHTPPARAVPGREVGLHAQSSHPPPERVELQTRSERRQPPAGRTPPPAGPGTAVRPPSRGREERRPRDGRRTPALATAHPAGLNGGPARRVRLSQIPGQGRRRRRATAAAERPGRRISAFHLDGAGKERGFAAGRHFLATTTAVPDEGAALARPAGLNAGAENHRLVD